MVQAQRFVRKTVCLDMGRISALTSFAHGHAMMHLTAPVAVPGLCAAQTPRHLFADSLEETLQRVGSVAVWLHYLKNAAKS